MAQTYYIVPRIRHWGALEVSPCGAEGLTAPIAAPPGCPGVLLVFDSMAALLGVFPTVNPAQVIVLKGKP